MASEVSLSVVVELIVGSGVLAGVGTGLKWFFLGGRKRVPVDNAQIVSDMATKAVEALVKPLTHQVTSLQGQLRACETRADDLERHLQQVLGYAVLCRELLVGNPAAPTPPSIVLDRHL